MEKKRLKKTQKESMIYAMPDLGIAQNGTRMLGGFYTGSCYSWDSDVPFIPVDATVNVCGTAVYRLKQKITPQEFQRRLDGVMKNREIYLKYAKDIKDEIQIVTNTINERTDESIKNSDVCLFMPGGIGTTYEILSSMETKRAGEHNNKIVIVNLFGYYNEFFKMLDEMYEKNFINESDKNMYKIVDTIEEAIDYIKK